MRDCQLLVYPIAISDAPLSVYVSEAIDAVDSTTEDPRRYEMNSTKISNLMTTLDVTRKGAERIHEIVKAGADLLLEEGFSSLTKRRIAKRLNMSHGNVSYYFPTRESLWHAVIDFELREYYERRQGNLKADPSDPQACFDEFVVRWIDEYNDRVIRVFFAHVIAFAEINESVAKIRDEVYESYFENTMKMARALKPDVEEKELENRVLEVMVVLEGLHAVSAFRPELVGRNYEFKQRLLQRVNAIMCGL
jgi:AcrR family transcriptional regulator